MTIASTRTTPAVALCRMVFGVFILVAGYTMLHHELWADELHAWNIANGSKGFFELIRNVRYEGHPPLWHILLWSISAFTNDLLYVQLFHLLIAATVVYLALFKSPFPLLTRLLIPFGYFFIYEYAVLSRNYAIAVLLAFCLCLVIRKEGRRSAWLYYALLFLLSNTHILGIILAGSMHLYRVLLQQERGVMRPVLIRHFLLGGIVLLPAAWLSFPPSEGSLYFDFWIDKWKFDQVPITAQSFLRAFVPIPAWWEHSSWNTQFLLDLQREHRYLKFITPLISLGIATVLGGLLWKNKKCFLLFLSNTTLSFVFSCTLFSLGTIRYTGFLFIGFLVAWWLYCMESLPEKNKDRIVNGLLMLQLIASILPVVKDIRYPFSNFNKVQELLKEVPAGERTTTDYWALNTTSAYTGNGLYCIDLQRKMKFITWGHDYKIMSAIPNRYYAGVKHLFRQEGIGSVYMISSAEPERLLNFDPMLRDSFRVELVDQRIGAIEKGGNLYLYHIQTRR